MANIPLGDFDMARVTPRTTPSRVDTSGSDAAGRAYEQAGQQMMRTTEQLLHASQQKDQEDNQLARVKASNAQMLHEIDIDTKVDDIKNRVASGELDYNKAMETYDKEITQVKKPALDKPDPVLAETLTGAVTRNEYRGKSQLGNFVESAKKADFKSQIVSGIDTIHKMSGMAGADTASLVARVEAFSSSLKMAGMDAKVIQDAKDKLWTTEVQQRSIAADGNLAAMEQIKFDLTNEKGRYADKLDPEKRTMAWRSIQQDISQLENKQAVLLEQREVAAEKEVAAFQDGIVLGPSFTPQRWQDGFAVVKGTKHEKEFMEVAKQADEILSVRRMPFAAQTDYITKLETSIVTTPSDDPKHAKNDARRLDTLRRTLDEGKKQASESPLTFLENTTGNKMADLDLTKLTSPAGSASVVGQMQQRVLWLSAARKHFGPNIALNPWKPGEAEMLKNVLSQAKDSDKLTILSSIAGAFPSAESYAGALSPLSADQRITMMAGMAQYKKYQSNEGTNVAETMLKGNRILADKTAIKPTEKNMLAAFDEASGDAFPAGSQQRADAYLAYKSIYMGIAADNNLQHDAKTPLVDDKTSRIAISLSTGGISEINGSKVVRPWGMSETAFDDRHELELERLSKQSGFSTGQLEDMPLRPVPRLPGSYYLMNGSDIQMKDGKPLVVKIK